MNAADMYQLNELGSKKHLRGFWNHIFAEDDRR